MQDPSLDWVQNGEKWPPGQEGMARTPRLEEHGATRRRNISATSVGALYRMAGTVWCGQGDGAATVYSLGGYSGTDRWG